MVVLAVSLGISDAVPRLQGRAVLPRKLSRCAGASGSELTGALPCSGEAMDCTFAFQADGPVESLSGLILGGHRSRPASRETYLLSEG